MKFILCDCFSSSAWPGWNHDNNTRIMASNGGNLMSSAVVCCVRVYVLQTVFLICAMTPTRELYFCETLFPFCADIRPENKGWQWKADIAATSHWSITLIRLLCTFRRLSVLLIRYCFLSCRHFRVHAHIREHDQNPRLLLANQITVFTVRLLANTGL